MLKSITMYRKSKKFAGFTLIELLVVIVIIGILATISVSTFQGYFEKARLAKAQQAYSQIKSLFLAQNSSTESNVFSAWYSFDGDSDVNQTSPYVIDKSGAKNNMIGASGAGNFSQSNDTGIGTGKSIRINKKGINTSNLINGGAISKFTIAFWFKLEDYNDFNQTFPVFFNSSAGFNIYPNNKIKMYVTGAGNIETSPNIFDRNKWYYIVGSYNGNSIKLWLDGDLIAEKNGVAQTNSFAGKRMYIGYFQSSQYFNGWLDEVMFLPYAFNGKDLE